MPLQVPFIECSRSLRLGVVYTVLGTKILQSVKKDMDTTATQQAVEWRPYRTGGHRDAAHAAAFQAGRVRYHSAGGAPRCCAPSRAGTPCQKPVKAAGLRCEWHGGRKAGRIRRARLLDPENATPAQIAHAVRRAALNRLARLWRKEPWTPGLTLDLGEHESAFRDALAAVGRPITALPYSTADWARWKFRRAFLDGQRVPDIWRDALAALPARIAKAGAPPAGWAWTEPAAPGGLAYTVPARLPAGSKRRLLDPPRVPRAAAPLPGLAAEDMERAAEALREHGDDLAPALALARTDDARLRLALAFARLGAGEIDHVAWLDALDAARAD